MAAQLISEARVSQPRLLGPYRGDGIRALVHLVAGHDPGMSPLSIDEWSYLNDRIYD